MGCSVTTLCQQIWLCSRYYTVPSQGAEQPDGQRCHIRLQRRSRPREAAQRFSSLVFERMAKQQLYVTSSHLREAEEQGEEEEYNI